jgi:hypothetical protein
MRHLLGPAPIITGVWPKEVAAKKQIWSARDSGRSHEARAEVEQDLARAVGVAAVGGEVERRRP